MEFYRYKIVRDFGFAPNPYHSICTLATCKKKIRAYAKVGDWIAAFGGKSTKYYKKLVYLMKINEKLTFNEYWKDERFQCKKAIFDKSYKYCYGDNIYHKNSEGVWIQENSHHSNDNEPNMLNLKRDTSVDQVLASNKFWYFGKSAVLIPDEFEEVIPIGRDFTKKIDEGLKDEFFEWFFENYPEQGVYDFPFSWKENLKFETYNGK